MDDIKSQIVNSITAQTQPQINGMFDELQKQLHTYLLIGTALTVLIVIVLTINTIYKIRVERAILRMDKNLQAFLEQQSQKTGKNTRLAVEKDTQE
jgi:hypothetical protein